MAKMTVKDTIRMLEQTIYDLQQIDDDLEVEHHCSYPSNGSGGDYVKPITQIDVEYEEDDDDCHYVNLGVHY